MDYFDAPSNVIRFCNEWQVGYQGRTGDMDEEELEPDEKGPVMPLRADEKAKVRAWEALRPGLTISPQAAKSKAKPKPKPKPKTFAKARAKAAERRGARTAEPKRARREPVVAEEDPEDPLGLNTNKLSKDDAEQLGAWLKEIMPTKIETVVTTVRVKD